MTLLKMNLALKLKEVIDKKRLIHGDALQELVNSYIELLQICQDIVDSYQFSLDEDEILVHVRKLEKLIHES